MNPKISNYEPPELRTLGTLLHPIFKPNFELMNLPKTELKPRSLLLVKERRQKKLQLFTNTELRTFRTSTFTLISGLNWTRTLQKDQTGKTFFEHQKGFVLALVLIHESISWCITCVFNLIHSLFSSFFQSIILRVILENSILETRPITN